VAVIGFDEAIQLKWLPPKSKILQVYASNVSSITINPKIGYRHKLLHIAMNGIQNEISSTTMSREAVDIILGPKTMLRYPAFLWGNSYGSIGAYADTPNGSSLLYFLSNWVYKNILDLLPDAADDEPLTVNAVSGNNYSTLVVRYAEYPSDHSDAHDVPGGSDYWERYFVAWFNILATAAGSGQQLTEGGEPYGMSLLGDNGRIPPNKAFHQISIETGYQNANQNSSITNYSVYNALHEWLNDEELFTPDTHMGLYINQQASGTQTDTTNFLFANWRRDVDFNPNDSLKLYTDVASVTGSGSVLWVVIDGILQDLSKKPAGGTP